MQSLIVNVSTSGEMINFLKYIDCHQAVTCYGCCELGMIIEFSNYITDEDDNLRGYEIIDKDGSLSVSFFQKRINLTDLIDSLKELIKEYGDSFMIIDIMDGIMNVDIHHQQILR